MLVEDPTAHAGAGVTKAPAAMGKMLSSIGHQFSHQFAGIFTAQLGFEVLGVVVLLGLVVFFGIRRYFRRGPAR